MLAPTDCSCGPSGPNSLRPRSGCLEAIRTGDPWERRCRTMRRPRKPVPPNTVTVRSFVATMIQIRQLMWDRTAVRMRWATRRLLLFLCWCARKHGRHTFRVDVEGQEYQRLVAWVSPLVHEGVRFIDQGTRSPCFCLTVDRVGPGAGDDEV